MRSSRVPGRVASPFGPSGKECDWQLIPFQSLADIVEYAESNGLLATLISDVRLQVIMNVVFFVPLGFFLAYRGRRSLGATALIGFCISLAIELTQGTGLWGLAPCPYRSGQRFRKHIALNNGTHQSVGGHPTIAPDCDFGALAEIFGFKDVVTCSSPHKLRELVSDMTQVQGARFVEVKLASDPSMKLPRPASTPSEMLHEFRMRVHEH